MPTDGNGFSISKEAWQKMPAKEQNWILYDTQRSINARLKQLERRPFYDKACSFLGGMLGGAAASIGINFTGK